MADMNTQLVLVCGESGTGKSASLRNITNQENWYYLNTEAGKRLPFASKFKEYRIEDPYQVLEAFDHATNTDTSCAGIIVDSLTFLMEMFESKYVLGSAKTMKGWSDYQQFFKALLRDRVIKFNKPVIFIAHVQDTLDEKTLEYKTSVPIKGALKGNGVEAYFSVVVMAKTLTTKAMENYSNDLLTISEEEEDSGLKYVFQTRKTKDSTGSRIRGPMGLWDKAHTYIDNDCQLLLNHLNEYYS